MTPDVAEFAPLAAEIFVLAMACFILVLDAYLPDTRRLIAFRLTQVTLLGAAVLTWMQYDTMIGTTDRMVLLGGTYVADTLSMVLKLAVYAVSAGVFLYSRDYLRDRGILKGEYFVLGLFGVLGMMVMISAHNMLSVYLGLELLSLSMYTMVAFQRQNGVASEAAMKYFVLGAIASGMLLYGISMIYGASGSLDLAAIGRYVAEHGAEDRILAFGVVFIVAGLAFKLGNAPFHMWVPDIYNGAPTSVTLFIGAAPKIAAFAMVMRVLVEGLGGLHADWTPMLIILAVGSLAVGNVIAIAQTNIKRMLAYSTISHMGFVVLGILAANKVGYSGAMFYAITYALTSAGGFGLLVLLSRAGFEAEKLDDLKGLNDRNPWLAFLMLLLMFSMAGVPPTVGFYAKLSVLQAVVSADMVWLAAVAVFFSIIGAFYYIRVVKVMYFDKPEDEAPIFAGFDAKAVLSVNGLAVLALGVYPSGLMAWCAKALG
ncbi:MAG: NADH-quinone oxidoreductase subunit NuoN [Gammaproteobacteria bacterium]|nr:NADH-quinone oxidoreductase subunit NuoN [Gammaproteobacteria bacterium]MCP5137185.1 NADH-quinone oxidoreductase subunit NuoN [Gammaproteobacteria bacterium]